MKLLQNKTNVTAPNGDYPYGDVKDNSGSNDGTPANSDLFADGMQFFEKMMAESGITANGLRDNDTNGFQLYEAFKRVSRPYKSYVIHISQTGTSAPTIVSTQENQIGTIVWTRDSAGLYSGTLNGAFTVGKTWATIGGRAAFPSFLDASNSNLNVIAIQTTNISGTLADGKLFNSPLEIRVYD